VRYNTTGDPLKNGAIAALYKKDPATTPKTIPRTRNPKGSSFKAKIPRASPMTRQIAKRSQRTQLLVE